MTDLTVLCVTAFGEYSLPFIDDMRELAEDLDARWVCYDGRQCGYIEACLDAAVAACPGDGHILRLDDDERVSADMYRWLLERRYRTADHWSFPRANLWPDPDHRLGGRFWPDLQTRLSVKAKAAGRHQIHAGSPFGAGEIAPVVIEHHKLLVRGLPERQAQARAYDRVRPGAGFSSTYGPLQLPELYPNDVTVVPYGAPVAA